MRQQPARLGELGQVVRCVSVIEGVEVGLRVAGEARVEACGIEFVTCDYGTSVMRDISATFL